MLQTSPAVVGFEACMAGKISLLHGGEGLEESRCKSEVLRRSITKLCSGGPELCERGALVLPALLSGCELLGESAV